MKKPIIPRLAISRYSWIRPKVLSGPIERFDNIIKIFCKNGKNERYFQRLRPTGSWIPNQ